MFRGWCCMSSGGCPRRWHCPTGRLRQRDRGTPQGSAVSPVLANLFMHYAFDAWMAREYPGVRFERYADDVVVHCVTERQARNLVAAIGDRMEQVGLRLHPDKTKIVYCKDEKRRLDYGLTAFTFLGFTFRTRTARGKSGATLRLVPASDQQRRPEQDQRSDPPMAAAPQDRAHPRRARTMDQPGRARLDAVLRGVLPLRAVSAPVPHQRLPDAVDPQEIQTVAHHQKAAACWQRVTSQHPRLFAHWAWAHGSWWSG